MKRNILAIAILAFSINSFAQSEKGKLLNKPNIKPNQKDKNFNKSLKKDDEFDFEEEPKLRFLHEFESVKPDDKAAPTTSADGSTTVQKIEAIKDLNTAVHEDTSSIDEGQVQVVEIEQQAQFAGSDDWVKIASYYSVWDNERVDPYGIDAKDFEDVVPIQLYDITQGRYWSGPMNKGKKSSTFGWRWHKWHTGTDLPLDTGDPVYAAFDGVVRVAGWTGGYGRCVVLRHYNGLETLYGHLSKTNYEPGTVVKAGDEIGLGGSTGHSTGPHLHFETRYEGNPFDAENVFQFSPDQINIISQEFLLTSRVYDYLRGGASKDNFELDDEAPARIVQTKWVRVRPNDTLSEIADRFNTSVSELMKLNRIKSTTRLRTGYRLRIK